MLLICAIDAAYLNICKYYTHLMKDLSDSFNMGHILNLSSKTLMYNSDDWDKDFARKSWANFFNKYNRCYAAPIQ